MYLKDSDPAYALNHPCDAEKNTDCLLLPKQMCPLKRNQTRAGRIPPSVMKKADFSPRKSDGDSRRADRTEVTYKTPLP